MVEVMIGTYLEKLADSFIAQWLIATSTMTKTSLTNQSTAYLFPVSQKQINTLTYTYIKNKQRPTNFHSAAGLLINREKCWITQRKNLGVDGPDPSPTLPVNPFCRLGPDHSTLQNLG